MPTQKKVQAVEELTDKLKRSTVAIGTDFTTMPVNAMTAMRKVLRAKGVEYSVVKNTLTERAADAAGRPEVKQLLRGPTGLAFGYGDPLEPIKAITEYVRSTRVPLVVRAAALEGRVYAEAQLPALLAIPPKSVLVSQLVGQLASPLVRLATVLNGPLRGLASVLQQRVTQQQGGG